jgi:glycosyltransferase involved in cell wall biosynthesis
VVVSWNVRQVELTVALLLARVLRTPVVLWGHGIGHSGSTIAKSVRRLQMKLATAVVVYSRAGAEAVRALSPTTPIFVAQNTTGHPPPEPEDELRELKMQVGYVGRFYASKRLDRLLRAIATLRAQGLQLEVCLMGSGPLENTLRELADELGIAEFVRFVPASSEWSSVKKELSQMDVVVFPEWAGLGVVDAFAAARAAVVLDSYSLNPPEFDYVLDGFTGIRYEIADSEHLAVALSSLYAECGLLQELSHNAAQFYQDNLSMSAVVEPFVEAIRSCRPRA